MPMVINVLAYWLVGMTLGYYLTFEVGHGPAGMWMGMIAGLTVAAVLLTIRVVITSRRFIQLAAARDAPQG